MKVSGTLYVEGNTFLHKLDGSVKLLLFLTWTIIIFMFLDIRLFLFIFIFGMFMMILSKVPFKYIKILFLVMVWFNIINSIFIILITPTYGTQLTGTSTPVFSLGYSIVNKETLFYVLTLAIKYANLLPATVIFIFTTHPSKFSSSLNKIGVPYKIAYAINIALRYIPDIQEEFHNIVNSQEARGVSFKKGEVGLKQKMKNYVGIAIPLVVSSLHRIEVVSNAMDLRCFGKEKKRTWYNATKCTYKDYVVAILCIAALFTAFYLKRKGYGGFYYPVNV